MHFNLNQLQPIPAINQVSFNSSQSPLIHLYLNFSKLISIQFINLSIQIDNFAHIYHVQVSIFRVKLLLVNQTKTCNLMTDVG